MSAVPRSTPCAIRTLCQNLVRSLAVPVPAGGAVLGIAELRFFGVHPTRSISHQVRTLSAPLHHVGEALRARAA